MTNRSRYLLNVSGVKGADITPETFNKVVGKIDWPRNTINKHNMNKTNHVESNETLTIFYDLGRIITEFRRRKGFTQKDFAEKCEITASYLSQVEKGHKMPSYALLAKICEQLGISQNDLFRLMFIDSFIESKDESKQEVIALLRDLLDKLILDEKRNRINELGPKKVVDMVQ